MSASSPAYNALNFAEALLRLVVPNTGAHPRRVIDPRDLEELERAGYSLDEDADRKRTDALYPKPPHQREQ